jgi:hypothetical protein
MSTNEEGSKPADEEMSEFRHFFLLKTIEYINNFSSPIKHPDNVRENEYFIYQRL